MAGLAVLALVGFGAVSGIAVAAGIVEGELWLILAGLLPTAGFLALLVEEGRMGRVIRRMECEDVGA